MTNESGLSPTSMNLQFMQAALALAQKAAELGEAPIGAVVVHQGTIVGEGYNTRELAQDVTGHAEIMALTQANRTLGSWRLPECDLYVTLEPCFMCAGAILQARIRHVYFGAYDPKGGAIASLDQVFDLPGLNHRVNWLGGVLQTACETQLKQFFRDLRTQKRRARQEQIALNGPERDRD